MMKPKPNNKAETEPKKQDLDVCETEIDLSEVLAVDTIKAPGSIAAPDNGSTLDINLDVEFSAESQVNITSIVHMLKNARDADEFHPPDIQASNEMDRTTHGFEEKESKVRLPFKERTEKNERNESEENEKSNEDRNIELGKTMEDVELEKNEPKGFEEKQNEEGVQEVEEESDKQSSEEKRKSTNKNKVCTDNAHKKHNEEKQNEEGVQDFEEESKQSSEETNKNKVCTDTAYKRYISLHRRTAAKNDLIVSVLLFKHKTMRQITKWYGNAQETCMGKDLYKSDQNKTDKTGQKNRHEKNTRCTWEPGIMDGIVDIYCLSLFYVILL